MLSNSREIGKVSQNLSLIRSPERKYFQSNSYQNKYSFSNNYYNPLRYSSLNRCCYCCCCPCRCYYLCNNCCCCYCCNPCSRLNFDYNNLRSSDEISNEPDLKDLNINKKENVEPSKEISGNENQENPNLPNKNQNEYFSYEQNQFNDFFRKLMEVEAKIEDAKIDLASNQDFICEDVFSLFETNNKDFLDEENLKKGLNLIGLEASDEDIKFLMKRFDLQKSGHINYADFFDMIVPFEKESREKVENRYPVSTSANPDNFNPNTLNGLKELFNLIINSEKEINEMRKQFGTLRLNLRDIFSNIDKSNSGAFSNKELVDYLGNNNMGDNLRDADLLFIRLDKNRNGKIEFAEVEDEMQTL